MIRVIRRRVSTTRIMHNRIFLLTGRPLPSFVLTRRFSKLRRRKSEATYQIVSLIRFTLTINNSTNRRLTSLLQYRRLTAKLTNVHHMRNRRVLVHVARHVGYIIHGTLHTRIRVASNIRRLRRFDIAFRRNVTRLTTIRIRVIRRTTRAKFQTKTSN